MTLTCTICFLARAIMFALLMEAVPRAHHGGGEHDQHPHHKDGTTSFSLLMSEEWVPMVVPCLALLYLMGSAVKPGPPAMAYSSPRGESSVEMRGAL